MTFLCPPASPSHSFTHSFTDSLLGRPADCVARQCAVLHAGQLLAGSSRACCCWCRWCRCCLCCAGLLARRRRSKLGVAFVPGRLPRDWSAGLRFLPDVVLALSLSFGLVALARPQRTDERVVQTGQGIDIVLALDVSGSMELQDLRPNRLEAAKRVALDFLNGRAWRPAGAGGLCRRRLLAGPPHHRLRPAARKPQRACAWA